MFYWKSYGIDILGASGIKPGFVDVCLYQLLGTQMTPRDFSGRYQRKLSLIISPLGRAIKRQIFFLYLTRQRDIL